MESNSEDEIVEIVPILNREEKIKQLIADLMTGKKTLSYSSLKAFKDSPNDFIEYVLKEKKQTEAMMLGTVIHCLVLEPKEFEKKFVVMDDTECIAKIMAAKPDTLKARSTSAYKAWKSEFMAKNADKNIVGMVVYNNAKFIANAVLNNRAARKILKLCTKREQKIAWEYKNFGFTGYYDGGGDKLRADLKLMRDAQSKKAQRTIIDMSYYLQSAMYLTAEEIMLPFYIIAFDRKGGVSVHKLHHHLIEHGLKEYEMLVDAFNKCIITEAFDQSYDFWAEMQDGIYVCDKPAYMY